jgi:hypothetical protein
MMQGTLVINLDPPFIGFFPKSHPRLSQQPDLDTWSYCTHEQIKQLLIDIDAIPSCQHWPPRECILRLPVTLSRRILAKHGLAKCNTDNQITPSSVPLVRRIS